MSSGRRRVLESKAATTVADDLLAGCKNLSVESLANALKRSGYRLRIVSAATGKADGDEGGRRATKPIKPRR